MQNSKIKTSFYAKASEDKQNYKPSEIESRWQKIWEKEKIYSPNLDKPFDKAQGHGPFYNLMMFPYPSAEGMHVGNMYAFTGADVYGRFKRMQGLSVFEPIGLDGFGIHSENYAIKVGHHPVEQAKISEKNFYRQLKSIGNGFDWTRTVETYKPNYYKWTQWLFVQLFKAGLAYRKKAPVNFCPSCKTVLAHEQVLDGLCERCSSVVEKKDLEQWFFSITKYADRLLTNIDKLDWSEKVKIAQRQWIGKSEGAVIRFKIKDLGLKNEDIEVFTTRADTLYGATFLVLSPEHPFVSSLLKKQFSLVGGRLARLSEIKEYVEKAKTKTEEERTNEGREKTGVFTGLYAINPVNNEKIPVWIANYVLMDYGTGALFGDAHDERDVTFARKYDIPLKPTLKTGDPDKDKKIKNLEECFTGYGILFDSGEFSGLTSKEAIVKITSWLEKKSMGRKETTYHLRDWLISRQRYWGPPIPMIYCDKCKWQPVPEDQLPVELPFIKDYKPLGTGKAPLANHPEFYKTKCPNCGEDARRETDVSDTFLDSSWYFLRYLATEWNDVPFPMPKSKIIHSASHSTLRDEPSGSDSKSSGQKLKVIGNLKFEIGNSAQRGAWLPVSMYIGGAEHSVLHLLYSRFITMVLKDLGFLSFEEPFTRFYAHGLLVKEGAKMSKSKGNVVVPDAYIKKFGADTLRTYLMFMGPFSQGGDFRDSGIEGMFRFIKRVWNLISSIKYQVLSIEGKDTSLTLDHLMHKTIKSVTEDIENLNYNTAIAHLMEYYNELFSFYTKYRILNAKYCKTLVLLLAPFAPHISEEFYQLLNDKKDFSSVHKSSWPIYDRKFLVVSEVVVVVQVNGKLRGNIIVDAATAKNKTKIEELARKDSRVQNYLQGKSVKRVVHVEGKIVNFVTV